MRERFVVAEADAHPAREALRRGPEAGFYLGVAFAKHGELHVSFEENRQIVEQKIEALLPGEAGYDAGKQHIRVGVQTQSMLQNLFIGITRIKRRGSRN